MYTVTGLQTSTNIDNEQDQNNGIGIVMESESQANNDWMPEAIPQLTVDVFKKNEIIYIISTVAGVSAADLDISFENNVLSIKGIRRKPYKDNEVEIFNSECFWGEFFREIPIAENINIERIEATLNFGVLTIQIPVIKQVAKKITIKGS
jgi:HSP20 family protein